jgi:hypothetical protein
MPAAPVPHLLRVHLRAHTNHPTTPTNHTDGGGLLVDLIDDEDLEMMWEEHEAALVGPRGCN